MAKYEFNLQTIDEIVSFGTQDANPLAQRYIPQELLDSMGIKSNPFTNPITNDATVLDTALILKDNPMTRQLLHNAQLFRTMHNMSEADFNVFDNVVDIFNRTQFGGKQFTDAFGSTEFSPAHKLLLVNDYMQKVHDSLIPANGAQNAFMIYNGESFDTINFTEPAPKRPGRFARLMHWLNSNWFKAEFSAYEQSLSRYNNVSNNITPVKQNVERVNDSIEQTIIQNNDNLNELRRNILAEPENSPARVSSTQNSDLRKRGIMKLNSINTIHNSIEDEIFFGDKSNPRAATFDELTFSRDARGAQFRRYSERFRLSTLDRPASRIFFGRMAMLARGYTYEQINSNNSALDSERRAAGREVTQMLENGDLASIMRLFVRATPSIEQFRFSADLSSRGKVISEINRMSPFVQDAINGNQTFVSTRNTPAYQDALNQLNPTERATFERFTSFQRLGGRLGFFTPASASGMRNGSGFLGRNYAELGIGALNDIQKVMNEVDAVSQFRSVIEGRSLSEVNMEQFNAVDAEVAKPKPRPLTAEEQFRVNHGGKLLAEPVNPWYAATNYSPAQQLAFESEVFTEIDSLIPSAQRVSVNLNENQAQKVNANQNTQQKVNQNVQQKANAPRPIMRSR